MKSRTSLAAAVVALALTMAVHARPAAETEAANASRLTGTPLGLVAIRDLRPQVIASSADYLGQRVRQADAQSKVSDVEVIFWTDAVNPERVEACRKLVTDSLAQSGYAYKVTGTLTAEGVTTTLFIAESNQGRVIGYWQAAPQGLCLSWGRVSGGSAPAPAAAPPAPAGADKDAEIAQLKRRLAEMEAAKGAAPAAAQLAAPVAKKDAGQAVGDGEKLPLGRQHRPEGHGSCHDRAERGRRTRVQGARRQVRFLHQPA